MRFITGEWVVDRTSAKQRRIAHYWLTILWFTVGLVLWIVLSNDSVRRVHELVRDLDHSPRWLGSGGPRGAGPDPDQQPARRR